MDIYEKAYTTAIKNYGKDSELLEGWQTYVADCKAGNTYMHASRAEKIYRRLKPILPGRLMDGMKKAYYKLTR